MPTLQPSVPTVKTVAVIGGGPAGLMAAETLARGGARVDVYDAMPSLGRKFLLAGVGGMNITHSEPFELFLSRYGARQDSIRPLLEAFPPEQLREWIHGLGIETFVGSSGRVFPREMKAAPLLRAWLHRLREAGVHFHVRHRWLGWNEAGGLLFSSPEQGEISVEAQALTPTSLRAPRSELHLRPAPAAQSMLCETLPVPQREREQTLSPNRFDAVVLALGGGSWSKLGSDGAWLRLLAARGVEVAPLLPSNCGFDVAGGWSEHLRQRFAGQPLKTVALQFVDSAGQIQARRGELMLSDTGIEGSLVYALSAPLRDTLAVQGRVRIGIDLAPDKPLERLIAEVSHPRGARSLSSHLQSRAGIKGVKMALLRELLSAAQLHDPVQLANAIKCLPLVLVAPRPLDEAISSAGGVRFEALDDTLMLRRLPGVFCAGEMLDWEAPTGGYLLTACLASGRAAGLGALDYLEKGCSGE